MEVKKIVFLIFLMISAKSFGADATLISPLNNQALSVDSEINISYRVNFTLGPSDRFVLFKSNNNRWDRVNIVAPKNKFASATIYSQTITPAFYFCRDTYAIRLMRGDQTIAGPVHFTAGVGACSGNPNSFVNLEKNLIDLLQFTPSDQLSRDTCGSFAGVSALEAAYKRLKNISVRLSQHYMHHIIKSSWLSDQPIYLYENQSSYWGGNDTLTSLKFMSWYPLPQLQFAYYQDQNQLVSILDTIDGPAQWSANPQVNRTSQKQIDNFEYDPRNIDIQARLNASYGVKSYEFKSGSDAKDTDLIEEYLKSGQEVLVGVVLKWSKSSSEIKTMEYDPSVSRGAHAMLIVGFDKTVPNKPYFLIKNSWGEGILRVSYDLITNTSSAIGVITDVRPVGQHSPSHWIGAWDMVHDQWRGKLIIRRNYELSVNGREPGQGNDIWPRIGEYRHQNGNEYCVWGRWTGGSTKLTMMIDFSNPITNSMKEVVWDKNKPAVKVITRNACPEGASGQEFELEMPQKANTANGLTWWNNKPFTARIWR